MRGEFLDGDVFQGSTGVEVFDTLPLVRRDWGLHCGELHDSDWDNVPIRVCCNVITNKATKELYNGCLFGRLVGMDIEWRTRGRSKVLHAVRGGMTYCGMGVDTSKPSWELADQKCQRCKVLVAMEERKAK